MKKIIYILTLLFFASLVSSYTGYSRFDNIWARGWMNVSEDFFLGTGSQALEIYAAGGNTYFNATGKTIFVNGVGIGMTPTATLHVNGSLNITTNNDVCIDDGICLSTAGGGDITKVNTSGDLYLYNGSDTGDVYLRFNETKLNNTINLRAAAFNETNLINSVNTSSNIQVLGFFNTTVIDATNTAQNNTLLLQVGARMMNGSLDLSLQGMNTTIALKASTTTVDATNTAQNNTILLEVGARAMNATLMSEVGARAMNATVMTLVGARMMNGSLDLSLQGMNTTIGLKAATTVVDATNTAQNTTIALKALPGNCPEGEYVENTTTSGVQCSAVAASSGGNISAQGATAGTIPRFQNGTIINNSIIFQNGTNVGIGTTGPRTKLDIGNAASFPADLIGLYDGGANVRYGIGIVAAAASPAEGLTFYSGDRGFVFRNQNINGTDLVRITNGGNVGIGTTTPDTSLDVLRTTGAQLRLTYADDSTYSNFTTDVNGDLNIRASGGDVIIMLG